MAYQVSFEQHWQSALLAEADAFMLAGFVCQDKALMEDTDFTRSSDSRANSPLDIFLNQSQWPAADPAPLYVPNAQS